MTNAPLLKMCGCPCSGLRSRSGMNLIPNSGPAVAALPHLSASILAKILQSGRESPMIRALATAALRLDVYERNDETYFILEGESHFR